jgi:hypothetical protein
MTHAESDALFAKIDRKLRTIDALLKNARDTLTHRQTVALITAKAKLLNANARLDAFLSNH